MTQQPSTRATVPAAEGRRDQYSFVDPRTAFAVIEPPVQQQEEPGLQSRMEPVPDLGETSYRGTGRLQGRRALITGGDSGIGAATAIAFAREGADVALSYLPEEQDDAEYVASFVEAAGRRAVLLPVDLGEEGAPAALVARAVEALGGLDAVVNVAGRQIQQPELEQLGAEQFAATFRVNVFATFEIVQAALPHLPAGSTIVNTASAEAYQPAPDRIDYAATKGAINNLSKGLAQQLVERGIRVNVVAPGPTWTVLQPTQGVDPEELPEFGASEAPLGRAAQPAEIAPAYVFLTSAESAFVVGATLNVNGGMPTP
ncbi:SDR family oxidoreductase [Arenivirga flava]|uniref:Dehydrogenase n=1 Tax=Arenivirga flava TaxID=1930060 RepID=A0AA37UH53_9MICO|nr:SDR family oxidoreductase [Arenivirga flava]GMA27177.1 dehydrogenase [Arenivirga flava]